MILWSMTRLGHLRTVEVGEAGLIQGGGDDGVEGGDGGAEAADDADDHDLHQIYPLPPRYAPAEGVSGTYEKAESIILEQRSV